MVVNGKLLLGLGALLFACGLVAALYGRFELTAVLAAFGGAAVAWGAGLRKSLR